MLDTPEYITGVLFYIIRPKYLSSRPYGVVAEKGIIVPILCLTKEISLCWALRVVEQRIKIKIICFLHDHAWC